MRHDPGQAGAGADQRERGTMGNDIIWQIILVLATGGTALWFLIRSLLRYRGW
ncbi:hypothetical protein ACFQ36_08635 [Arthrobacter sp. GCM10027362]|uniref:hypothetical protein n=1 Tax=Arthrobacter sp. GCM10027362 TaxID=3273379 RepID=UPI00362779A1